MTDASRGARCWDAVLIGCGKAKQAEAAPAIDLYTGPVFKAHRAIAEHLDEYPYILSAEHGLLAPRKEVEPYDTRIADIDLAAWSARVLRDLEREVLHWTSSRITGFPYCECFARPLKGRSRGCTHGINAAFGPPRQPALLVLAGPRYVDGWAPQLRARGVLVDDPLRGMTLGERRAFAARFVAETQRWRAGTTAEDIGWTRREQLLDALMPGAAEDLAELGLEVDEPVAPCGQLGLRFDQEVAAHG